MAQKGKFVLPELDLELTTEPFKAEGKPYEWKPKIVEKTKPKSAWDKIKAWLTPKYTEQLEQPTSEYPEEEEKEYQKIENEEDEYTEEESDMFEEI